MNVKRVLAHCPDFAQKLGAVDYIDKEDYLADIMKHFNADSIKAVALKLKVPAVLISRIIDMCIYSKIEGPTVKPNLHKQYRITMKRKLFIKCLRDYPEIFKGKKEQLLKHTMSKGEECATAYLWNQTLPGDEFGMQSIKDLQGD